MRIEDTDVARSTKIYEKDMIDSLQWLSLDRDAGPGKDDGNGPYYQMERLEIYNKYLQQLLDEGKAYYAWESTEELDEARKIAESAKKAFRYRQKEYTPEQIEEFKKE